MVENVTKNQTDVILWTGKNLGTQWPQQSKPKFVKNVYTMIKLKTD